MPASTASSAPVNMSEVRQLMQKQFEHDTFIKRILIQMDELKDMIKMQAITI